MMEKEDSQGKVACGSPCVISVKLASPVSFLVLTEAIFLHQTGASAALQNVANVTS